MAFALKTTNGDDVVTEYYPTHQCATWHMWNDENEDGKPKWLTDDGQPFVYVWDVPDADDMRPCPKCGADDFAWDGDTWICDTCFHVEC